MGTKLTGKGGIRQTHGIKPATKAQQKFFEDAVKKAEAEISKPEYRMKMNAYRIKEDKLFEPYQEKYKPIMLNIDINELFINLRNSAYDRPSAFWEVCALLGREGEELAMHSPIDMIWNDGEVTEEGELELKYLNEFFDGNIPPAILESGWST